jgi:hypothetical protein
MSEMEQLSIPASWAWVRFLWGRMVARMCIFGIFTRFVFKVQAQIVDRHKGGDITRSVP